MIKKKWMKFVLAESRRKTFTQQLHHTHQIFPESPLNKGTRGDYS